MDRGQDVTVTVCCGIGEMDERSPRANQPSQLTDVQLKPHQLAALYRCHSFERGCVRVGRRTLLESKTGILGDKVGAGKSFVVLGLIAADADAAHATATAAEPTDKPVVRSYGLSTVSVSRWERMRNTSPATVIVIPHNLFGQWDACIRAHLPLRVRPLQEGGGGEGRDDALSYFAVGRRSHVDALASTDVCTWDVVLVTTTFYGSVADVFNARDASVRRVVYDEADSMRLPTRQHIRAKAMWFVTASFQNLLSCGHVSARTSGYVRALFGDLITSDMADVELGALVVKNSDAFVDASFRIPDLDMRVVWCRTPYIINVLEGNVDAALMERLNADDVEGALQCLDPMNRQPEENIVNRLIAHYMAHVARLDAKIAELRERAAERTRGGSGGTSDALTEAHVREKREQLESECARVNCRIASIRQRVTECDMCPICYEPPSRKTVLPCCSHAYCFRCLNVWLATSKACPVCKAAVASAEMLVVEDTRSSAERTAADCGVHDQCGDADAAADAAAGDWDVEAHPAPHGGVREIRSARMFDKLTNFTRLMRSLRPGGDRGRKVLVFANYETSLDKVEEALDRMGMRSDTIKGSVARIARVLQEYAAPHSGLDVLLANAANYGSGLNLANTTDVVMFHKFDDAIEKQVIGRAQRCGRHGALRVWYLLHGNERKPSLGRPAS